MKPLYYCCNGTHGPVRLRGQGAPRAPGSSVAVWTAGGPRRIPDLPELLHRPHAVRRRAAAAGGLVHARARRRRARCRAPATLLGLPLRASRQDARDESNISRSCDRLFSQAVSRQLVSDVDVGAYLSGGMDSGSITAIAAPQLPYMQTFTCGFDLHSASGLELGFDERQAGRAHVVPVQDRALRDGAQGRRHGARACRASPGISRSRASARAIRTSTPRSSRQVRARSCSSGTGGDELFGGYPWRYYRAVVNDDFEHYVDKYYALLAAADARATRFAACLRADLDAGASTSRRATSSADVFQTHARRAARGPRTTSTTRSTSRRRRSCTGCSSSRTS